MESLVKKRDIAAREGYGGNGDLRHTLPELVKRLTDQVYVPDLVSIQQRFGYADGSVTSEPVYTPCSSPHLGPPLSLALQSPNPEKEQENSVDMQSLSTTLSLEGSPVSSQPTSPFEAPNGTTLQETEVTLGYVLTENDFQSRLSMLSEVSLMKENLEHQNGRILTNSYCYSPLPEEFQNGSENSDSSRPDEHHSITNGVLDSGTVKCQGYLKDQVSSPVRATTTTSTIALFRSGIVVPVGDFPLSPTQPQYNKPWYTAFPVSSNYGRHLQLPSFQSQDSPVNGFKHNDAKEQSDVCVVKAECQDCVGNCNGELEASTSSPTVQEPKRNQTGPYNCDMCGDRFTTTNLLGQHMRVHSVCKPFTCHYCQKTFTQRSHLTRHLYTHTGEKPYKCPHCDRSFARSTTLSDHINTHTRSRPHKCWYCEKSFNQKSGLRYHIRTHTGERPFDCVNCSRSFISSSQLVKHICRPVSSKS